MAMKKIGIITLIIITFLSACQSNETSPKDSTDNSAIEKELNKKESIDDVPNDEAKDQASDETSEQKDNINGEQEKKEEYVNEDGIVVISDPNDIHLVVNKQRKLTDGYEPEDLVFPNVQFSFVEWNEKKHMREVSAKAMEELFAESAKQGMELVAVSGYRSYERQKAIYNYNVETQGLEHAQKYSAMPGHSEHQTGLTMDVSAATVAFSLEEDFRQTKEGEWLEKHAHEYGFIIRYPKGKEEITGYSYEPWHIRYVGKDVAKEIYEQQITLEEFFNLVP